MKQFDDDDAVYERRIFFLQHYLRTMIFVANEVIVIGGSIGKYETAFEIMRQNSARKRSEEVIEMAVRYKQLILCLRKAEEFLETGVIKR
jgi:hypothetical protein